MPDEKEDWRGADCFIAQGRESGCVGLLVGGGGSGDGDDWRCGVKA